MGCLRSSWVLEARPPRNYSYTWCFPGITGLAPWPTVPSPWAGRGALDYLVSGFFHGRWCSPPQGQLQPECTTISQHNSMELGFTSSSRSRAEPKRWHDHSKGLMSWKCLYTKGCVLQHLSFTTFGNGDLQAKVLYEEKTNIWKSSQFFTNQISNGLSSTARGPNECTNLLKPLFSSKLGDCWHLNSALCHHLPPNKFT